MKHDFDTLIDRRNTNSVKWDYCEDGVLPMWVADMDFESPKVIVDAITKRAAHGTFGYTWATEPYYQAITDWMNDRHGWEIRKDWIIPTPGVIPALCLAISAYSQPGDKIVIQAPVYHPFKAIILRNGREPVENPLKFVDGSYGMDYDQLEDVFDERTKVLILCSPHNPIGRVWKKDELSRLAETCMKHGVIIVADEIHSDIIMEGHKHVPLATLSEDISNNSVTCTAASKTFNLAGLACSNVIISNGQLFDRFKTAIDKVAVGTPNIFGMLATQVGYTYGKEWLEQLLKYLKGNYDFLVSYLEEHIPRIKPFPLEGTYLVWLDFREFGLPDMRIKDILLNKAGVWLDHGPQFGTGGEGFQRMNIACPRNMLKQALSRIAGTFGAT